MDLADFLQELATPEGGRFIDGSAAETAPRGTDALAAAFKQSDLFPRMNPGGAPQTTGKWNDEHKAPFAGSFFFYLGLLIQRQIKLTSRNAQFIKTRIMQTLINSAIIASLFSSLSRDDNQTMYGFLFQVFTHILVWQFRCS